MAVKIEFPGVADHETHFVNDLLGLPGVKDFFEAWQVRIEYEGLVDLGPNGCDRSDFVEDEDEESLALLKKEPLLPQDLYDRAKNTLETFGGHLADMAAKLNAHVNRICNAECTDPPRETKE